MNNRNFKKNTSTRDLINFQAERRLGWIKAMSVTNEDFWLLVELHVSHCVRAQMRKVRRSDGNNNSIRKQFERIRHLNSHDNSLRTRIDWAFNRYNKKHVGREQAA